MAAKSNNSPIKLFFTRGTRVRKEQIPGEPAGDVESGLMKIVPRGAKITVANQPAKDLIIGGSALEDNLANKEHIAELEAEFKEISQREARLLADKSKQKKAA